ncbi:tRNA-His guanylyltransferase [Emydomyces testavorans]|uniref:tRNA(His) guanylyltransferase n=1 Tax=Emydomyces testavorans TaxID=2070801 RepID=A0AAF0DAL8_9EURO|nr:tRNA-His guanylyltransferase [Emydomyces testavorans]
MANSKYEYVKAFERDDVLLPNTWIVVRIDGRGFHKFSSQYQFRKPNDVRALNLMNVAAKAVMRDLSDLIIAYGVSDEFSKLVSTVVSTFTAHYVHAWPEFFPSMPLELGSLPTFDGRAVEYPSVQNLRDYMSWRQVDCHINNLYNTTFWSMVLLGGVSNTAAEYELKAGLLPRILFELQPIDPQGNQQGKTPGDGEKDDEASEEQLELSKTQREKRRKLQRKADIAIAHVDIIKDEFWEQRPWILSNRPGKLPEI